MQIDGVDKKIMQKDEILFRTIDGLAGIQLLLQVTDTQLPQ